MAARTWFTRSVRTLLAVLPLTLIPLIFAPPPCLANPLPGPMWSLRACDSNGHIYGIYVFVPRGLPPVSWTAYPMCDVPDLSYGASDLALTCPQPGTAGMLVQGRAGSPYLQQLDDLCQKVHPTIGDHADFTGLDCAGGTLYGIALVGTSSSLCTISATTGHVSCVVATPFAGLTGLAWHEPSAAFFSLEPTEGGTDLVMIDPLGDASTVGSTGVADLVSLTSSNGFLLAGSGLADGGRLYVIDPSTGAARLIPGDVGNFIPEISGLTTDTGFVVPVRPTTWGQLKAIYR